MQYYIKYYSRMCEGNNNYLSSQNHPGNIDGNWIALLPLVQSLRRLILNEEFKRPMNSHQRVWMIVTRRRLHRREILPDSDVDCRRRRLTSSSLSSALTLTTITHRNHGEARVFCKSTLSTDRRLYLLAYGFHFNVSPNSL